MVKRERLLLPSAGSCEIWRWSGRKAGTAALAEPLVSRVCEQLLHAASSPESLNRPSHGELVFLGIRLLPLPELDAELVFVGILLLPLPELDGEWVFLGMMLLELSELD